MTLSKIKEIPSINPLNNTLNNTLEQPKSTFSYFHIVGITLAFVMIALLFWASLEIMVRALHIVGEKEAKLLIQGSFNPFLAVFGLTLIALSFGVTLATFLADDGHEAFLNTVLGKKTVYVLAKIGTYSYAIYLFHAMIIIIVQPFAPNLWIRLLKTLFVFFATLLVGIVATELIEKPILRWRNKYVK